MTTYQHYINRCLQLAKKGLGTTYPNPLVGSVIVHNNLIVGEGWHRKAGEAHAEVHAINSVKDKLLLKESTIYVSLEPCSHFGKTPPCANLIIKHGIPNVVIGTQDPFSKVQGRGIKILKDAGCNVHVGVMENACQELNKRFFTFHNHKRPYVILKWAQTANAFIAPKKRDSQHPVWITNAYSRQLVHKWRSKEQAILIGTTTALDDNPSLTTRDWTGNNPKRLVIDRTNILPESLNVFNEAAETIRITETDFDFKNLSKSITDYCYAKNIQSLIVEGGRQTLQTFIDANLWDEARVFEGTLSFESGVKAPVFRGELSTTIDIKGDILKIYKNRYND